MPAALCLSITASTTGMRLLHSMSINLINKQEKYLKVRYLSIRKDININALLLANLIILNIFITMNANIQLIIFIKLILPPACAHN